MQISDPEIVVVAKAIWYFLSSWQSRQIRSLHCAQSQKCANLSSDEWFYKKWSCETYIPPTSSRLELLIENSQVPSRISFGNLSQQASLFSCAFAFGNDLWLDKLISDDLGTTLRRHACFAPCGVSSNFISGAKVNV